jgi:hypothetical protein
LIFLEIIILQEEIVLAAKKDLIGLLFIVISADRNLIGKEVKSHDRQTYTRNNPAARYISIRSTASILRLNQST